MTKNHVIKAQNIFKSFPVGGQSVEVLKDVSFEVHAADFLVIFGPSGCGKSTLLHTVLGLEPPTSGTIYFLSENIYEGRDEDARSEFRKRHVGTVYQQSNWIKALSVCENVAFPLSLLGVERSTTIKKAYDILKMLEMDEWATYIPTELSSGQQQRIALARALISNPEVIIADEPTGNLDYESGQKLMQLLVSLNKSQGKTIVMVTHDLEYLKFAKTVIKMFDGTIVGRYHAGEKQKLQKEIKSKRKDKNHIVQKI